MFYYKGLAMLVAGAGLAWALRQVLAKLQCFGDVLLT